MKPKFANFTDFYDQVNIYTLSGVRTDTGGYTETETLSNTIWADVRQNSGTEFEDTDAGDRREFEKTLRVKVNKGRVDVGQLLEYKGVKNYVYSVDTSNPAYDTVFCRETK